MSAMWPLKHFHRVTMNCLNVNSGSDAARPPYGTTGGTNGRAAECRLHGTTEEKELPWHSAF